MNNNQEQQCSSSLVHDPNEIAFTVFTPAYNRKNLLGRVYESLRKQTFRHFEWIIVDDGSTDGTEEIARPWMDEAEFPIKYLWKENGGKHMALNKGVREARGRYFVVIDSDDWLVPNALEVLSMEWERIQDKKEFVGVIGLFSYEDGTIVGNRFPEDRVISNSIDLRYRLKVHGDKIGASRTSVLRQYPFPTDLGRNYVSESLVWNRISQKYDTLFINKTIGMKQYQAGGITDNSRLNDFRNPMAGRLHAIELLENRRGVPLRPMIKAVVRLIKCSYYEKRSPFAVRRLLCKILVPLLTPVAVGVVIRDAWRLQARKRIAAKSGPIRPV